MGLTKTVHPPAGATALLAVVDDRAVPSGLSLDEEKGKSQGFEILIGDKIIVPDRIQLSAEERLLLEQLASRL